jgi:hypothetical protein
MPAASGLPCACCLAICGAWLTVPATLEAPPDTPPETLPDTPETLSCTDDAASSAVPMTLSLMPTAAPLALSACRRAMLRGVTASPSALTSWLSRAWVCSISARSTSGSLLMVIGVPRFL